MAVNSSRSMRFSLEDGATDGRYRKVRPDTACDDRNTAATMQARQHLHPWYNYGYLTQELPVNGARHGGVSFAQADFLQQ